MVVEAWVTNVLPLTVKRLVLLSQVRLAALPKAAGVPPVLVQYGSWPDISVVEVETEPPPPPEGHEVRQSAVRHIVVADMAVVEALPKVVSPATFKVVDLRFEIVEEELLERNPPKTLASPETYKEVVVALPPDI